MKKAILLLSAVLMFSCSKDDSGDDCPCRTATVEGFNYQVRICDQETFDNLEAIGTQKEAKLIQENSNCP